MNAILADNGFEVAAAALGQRSGGAGYMTNWFATRV
jgi:hypothetical protein